MQEEFDDGSTASQKELDSQTEAQKVAAGYVALGQINLAKQQINTALGKGGDRDVARDLLGRLDRFGTDGDEAEDGGQLFKEFTDYLDGTRIVARAQAARQAPAAQAAKPKADLNKARRDYSEGKISTLEARKLGIV